MISEEVGMGKLPEVKMSDNKRIINPLAQSVCKNIRPRSFLYKPRCARSVLSRPRFDIFPFSVNYLLIIFTRVKTCSTIEFLLQ